MVQIREKKWILDNKKGGTSPIVGWTSVYLKERKTTYSPKRKKNLNLKEREGIYITTF